jgi:hypothetical protein
MSKLSRLPEPKRAQVVIEWRYPKAHRYWDVAGTLMRQVEQAFPGYSCETSPRDGFQFVGPTTGMVQGTFYWDKATVTYVEGSDSDLVASASRYWAIVSEALQPSQLLRLGHRTWLCYDTPNPTDGVGWLRRLKAWEFARKDFTALGEPDTAGVVLRTVLAEERRLRTEVNAGTIEVGTAGGVSRRYTGVVVDIDIAIEGDALSAVSPDQFLQWNVDYMRANVHQLFRTRVG